MADQEIDVLSIDAITKPHPLSIVTPAGIEEVSQTDLRENFAVRSHTLSEDEEEGLLGRRQEIVPESKGAEIWTDGFPFIEKLRDKLNDLTIFSPDNPIARSPVRSSGKRSALGFDIPEMDP